MTMTPEFKKRLQREIALRLREMRDGCPDCMDANGGYCDAHEKEAIDTVMNPRKYIQIEPSAPPQRTSASGS